MIEKTVVRRLFLAGRAPLQSTVFATAARYGRPQPLQRYYSSLPSVTQVSFWESMIPKPLRRSNRLKTKKPKSAEWNPATFFIAILLLIGSMSIQMIALRNEFATFIRRADAKIDLLREVIEKVQSGEEVDVEGLLGAGNLEKEQEWEEVLKEIEKEDEQWTEARRTKPRRRSPQAVESAKIETAGASDDTPRPKQTSNAPRGFY
ncbi:hypothetical protein V499_01546 [Pseudogymnoascus sp. VKM F-103]|uniref:Uncharacterized protein n=1 Tax=Pseudogymnoascus verrucosus TaxID=342668 RepID=A0A1B8GXS4_9PEZI|nr:uncharacterized protein VE01_01100 [Pseudogymnoascus verrucosus]KFY79486.1 hypothetical protein V499_01546 [Pseudogymnoascus sp. VKM F-103]OBU00652.1 hypothetical protein VE01_01100 [Pseudogymnoascus verrucosus]